jgi:hypothetical protein
MGVSIVDNCSLCRRSRASEGGGCVDENIYRVCHKKITASYISPQIFSNFSCENFTVKSQKKICGENVLRLAGNGRKCAQDKNQSYFSLLDKNRKIA